MSDNREQENKMPDIPGMPHNFEGFPEYEEKLKQPCFYTGRPCDRAGCPRWITSRANIPSKLAPGQVTTYTFHQCKDDMIDNTLARVTQVINQIVMSAQAAQQQAAIQQLGLGNKRDIDLKNINAKGFRGFKPGGPQ